MAHKRYISTNFYSHENVCHCGCGEYSADVELVDVMEETRLHFLSNPFIVHSWFRCRPHNNRPTNEKNERGVSGVGSGDYSHHLYGRAVDFHINNVELIEIRTYLRRKYPDVYGIGIYNTFIHLDVRPTRADWDNRTGM